MLNFFTKRPNKIEKYILNIIEISKQNLNSFICYKSENQLNKIKNISEGSYTKSIQE